MAQRIVAQDIAEVAADLLEAEKRKIDDSEARFQTDFEAGEAKFNAIEALTQQKSTGFSENSKPEGSWLLARKCWAWLYGD